MAKRHKIAVDFDGVLHSYVSGWTGHATSIADVPTGPHLTAPDGDAADCAITWLREVLDADIAVIIHTCRLNAGTWRKEGDPDDVGDLEAKAEVRGAIVLWLIEHGLAPEYIERLEFSYWGKPSADVYIDDRGYRFEGKFPSPELIRSLRPWTAG